MRYVRTKEGNIYELKNCDLLSGFPLHIKVLDEKEDYSIYEYSAQTIERVANKIEELCDEAIFFDEDNVPHYKSKEGNIWYLGAGLFTESLRFGIFTDKGLIYVAKMNDKGELELI